ncbi:MAG: PDDEXK nuclease domain-containing protein [Methylococcaceae bacterium]|nr:PDDEXK nuclease domain-containing protein [Methylococcaceae bacterium]
MNTSLLNNQEYKHWLKDLKQKLLQAQLKAVVKVNSTLLEFYWELGEEIVFRQSQARWGDGFLKQLSQDLMAEFPEMKGFSKRNLEQIRKWYLYWSSASEIAQQPVSQLWQIPWGHNLKIIAQCQSIAEALYYVQNTLDNGWSRSVLTHQIESGLWQREGKAISNFSETLPAPQSDLAQQALKDPYVFDFLTLSKQHSERELEQGLIEHITHFLLELGAGFAYMGKQYPIQVGERDFFIDLLFYHAQLHCYVVIELKIGDFEPEHAGKLNFYIKAIDEQLRSEADQPTIGILLCKNKDRLVAEYALSDIQKPMGVSEYQLTQSLPKDLQSKLPSIEAIENELSGEV